MAGYQSARRTRRKAIIFVTALTALVSLVLLIVSVATSSWISGTAREDTVDYEVESSYGLFSGELEVKSFRGNKEGHNLEVVCNEDDGVCMMACDSLSDAESSFLLRALIHCPKVDPGSDSCRIALGGFETCTNDLFPNGTYTGTIDRTFIQASFRIATCVFWAFAAFFATLCLGLSILNTVTFPSHTILSTFGLYIVNSLTGGCAFLVLVLWGAHYSIYLSDNLMVLQTLSGWFPKNEVSLGYSYWLIFPSMLLHLGNIPLIYWSDRPERQTARQVSVQDKQKEVGTMLF